MAPRLPAAYIGQAEAHMLMDDPTAAFGALNAWKAADPGVFLPSRVIATVHLARGSAPLAIQELQGALKVILKDAETLSALGGAYLAAGNRQAASTQFAAALAVDAKNVTAAMGQAELAAASGNTERALAAFEAVLAIDPAHAVAQNNVAWLRPSCYSAEGVFLRSGQRVLQVEVIAPIQQSAYARALLALWVRTATK